MGHLLEPVFQRAAGGSRRAGLRGRGGGSRLGAAGGRGGVGDWRGRRRLVCRRNEAV
ncbi:hypersensitivity response secretion protein hrcV (plasmid) [Ralstonia solanacearum]|nr:hypersensitivity response secretion protein hrcV [Ralstonia solanacearum]